MDRVNGVPVSDDGAIDWYRLGYEQGIDMARTVHEEGGNKPKRGKVQTCEQWCYSEYRLMANERAYRAYEQRIGQPDEKIERGVLMNSGRAKALYEHLQSEHNGPKYP